MATMLLLKQQIKKLIESDFIYMYISLQTGGPPLKMLWRRTSKKLSLYFVLRYAWK